MKRIVCLICSGWIFVTGFTQTLALTISKDKTTSLIFPFAIRHVDRGTRDVLVQQVQEADNILLVKAATEGFTETNLSVVTDDGSVYSFVVNFENKPSVWVYNLPANKKQTVATYANGILDNPATMHGLKDHSHGITVHVSGIYIKENVIYYQVQQTNDSPIDYDIELLRFYIRDKKKSKRTAAQEYELKPLHVSGNISIVKARSRSTIVVALEKFTVPDAKYLAIQVMEKNGGRHLLMRVNNRKIVQAIPLPDLR
ncbi:MAG TPA: conjugative transposon protein TraN [Chitinophagaceae bacterium]|nr:conjugative transposon protein TraN [Chitinophagaceae bacterium]